MTHDFGRSKRPHDASPRKDNTDLPLKLSIKTSKTRELKHREERLGVELGAPVPRRGEPAVDAAGQRGGDEGNDKTPLSMCTPRATFKDENSLNCLVKHVKLFYGIVHQTVTPRSMTKFCDNKRETVQICQLIKY